MTTWEDENTQILDALVVERNVMFFLLFFVMIVAAFGICRVYTSDVAAELFRVR